MSAARQEAPTIKHKEGRYTYNSQNLSAFYGDVYCGGLTYFWNAEKSIWELETLEVGDQFRGKGIGLALINAFAEKVGPDQPVHGAIIHPRSQAKFAEAYRTSGLSGEYLITEEGFAAIPLARALKRGGIEVTKISVAPNLLDLEDNPFEIELWGKTRQFPQS